MRRGGSIGGGGFLAGHGDSFEPGVVRAPDGGTILRPGGPGAVAFANLVEKLRVPAGEGLDFEPNDGQHPERAEQLQRAAILALPDKYKNSGDLRDYYHIGLVDDDPAWVLNAQSAKTGFVRSRLRENWCAVGYLNKVKYEEEVVPMSEMRVFCDHGSSVNLRRQPSVSAALVCTVPKGAAVEAGPCDVPEWMAVQGSGKSGYMMSAFLREADAATDAGADPADLVTLQLPQAAAMALRDALIRVMGVG